MVTVEGGMVETVAMNSCGGVQTNVKRKRRKRKTYTYTVTVLKKTEAIPLFFCTMRH